MASAHVTREEGNQRNKCTQTHTQHAFNCHQLQQCATLMHRCSLCVQVVP